MLTDTKETYWAAATFLSSVIITGLLFRFNYTEWASIPMHDAFIEVHPLQFTVAFWIALAFLVFLVGCVRDGFSRVQGLMILAVTTGLVAGMAISGAYILYSIIATYAVLDVVFNQGPIAALPQQAFVLFRLCLILAVMLIAVELWVVHRIRKIKNQ